jgi:hypothetical protein
VRRPSLLVAGCVVVFAAAPALGLAGSSNVTISVRNTVLRWGEQATLTGAISSPRAEEKVVLEVKECGQPSFRAIAWAYSQPGGGWTYDMGARVSSQYRAVWGEEKSGNVSVRQRPYVTVVLRPGGRGEVGVNAIYPFSGKRVSIQVFDKKTRTWKQVQSVKLTESGAGGSYVWSSGKFRPRLPKNAQIRGVFPFAQAKPCYLAGYSGIVQT